MGSKMFHWCPNACGKSVVYTFELGTDRHFKCNRCLKLFTKEELEAY